MEQQLFDHLEEAERVLQEHVKQDQNASPEDRTASTQLAMAWALIDCALSLRTIASQTPKL